MSDDESRLRFDVIVSALGGASATARLLGRKPSQISQWRARGGLFPAELYFVLREALADRGYRLPRNACRFEEAGGLDLDQLADDDR